MQQLYRGGGRPAVKITFPVDCVFALCFTLAVVLHAEYLKSYQPAALLVYIYDLKNPNKYIQLYELVPGSLVRSGRQPKTF